ncbi:Eco57I restriction-modification methylase domain-containing protein [Schaalia hyovaginalis]|uniref:Eco57I restriction-modification methylase domain-containing protein n=1 Tax=Schaalia hyovaginalis TaxID=29316 RepID=UPI002A800054|nr:hypothetical protein [Schaalia hyovaginalis]MDY3665126.1 hypothetical protein [Schaalia hyovaginalis]
MKETFPEGKSDLFAGFVIRCLNLLAHDGLAGFMTPFVWMFIKSYEALRRRIIERKRIVSLIQLEYSGFEGATVPICTYVLQNGRSEVAGSFVRLSDFVGPAVQGPTALKIIADDKATRRGASTSGMEQHLFRVSSSSFTAIPGSPIVYWLSEKMRRTFAEGQPLGEVAKLRQGLATADNNRFLREWWEVSIPRIAFACTSREDAVQSGAHWFPYNKGGDFRKWYGNQEFVVNWENDGAEIRSFGTENGGRTRSRPQNTETYFSPSVSWSDISSGAPSFRYFPGGFIHGNKGNSAFGPVDTLDRILSILNSQCVTSFLEALTPTLTASVGDVAKVPLHNRMSNSPSSVINATLIKVATNDWDGFETSWNFYSNPLVAISRCASAERN